MYALGYQTNQDYSKAKEWFAESAHLGDKSAQYALGRIFANGLGLPENNIKAYLWWSLAKAQQHREATIALQEITESMTLEGILEAQKLASDKYNEIQENIRFNFEKQAKNRGAKVATTATSSEAISPTTTGQITSSPPPSVEQTTTSDQSEDNTQQQEKNIFVPVTNEQNSVRPCTEIAWDCEDYGECESGKKHRTCTLIDNTCRDAGLVKPDTVEECSVPKTNIFGTVKSGEIRTRMNTNLDYWRKIQGEMLELGKGYVEMKATEGLRKLDMIEDEFVLRFNEYVKIYNESIAINDHISAINIIEGTTEKLIQEFKALPNIYY